MNVIINHQELDGNIRTFWIPTEKLRNMIIKKTYQRIVSGGDGNRSKMYLFTYNNYIKYFDKLNKKGDITYD